MGLFLVIFWCSAIADDAEARIFLAMLPGSARLIPAWDSLNSRIASLREFGGKGLIWLTVSAANGGFVGYIDEIPGSTGKTGNFAPPAERGAASRQRRRPRLPGTGPNPGASNLRYQPAAPQVRSAFQAALQPAGAAC